jgi:hypothetical protein
MTANSDPNDHAARALERRASAWAWDAELERLAADTSVLDKLPPARRVSLGHYLASKRSAEAFGIDTTNPEGQA